jgi:transcriptional regulator with XRE-family HTH domain
MSVSPPGVLLREWRTRRRYSQLALALVADVSAKHLSYVETGRSTPSREMIVHLCEHLDVPLRVRNDILFAAGFAPRYPDSKLDGTARMRRFEIWNGAMTRSPTATDRTASPTSTTSATAS